MGMPQETLADAVARLRKVEGQVAGIIRMIESGRECRDVVTQLSAASKALDQTGFKLLASGMRECVAGAEQPGYTMDELERMFLKLA